MSYYTVVRRHTLLLLSRNILTVQWASTAQPVTFRNENKLHFKRAVSWEWKTNQGINPIEKFHLYHPRGPHVLYQGENKFLEIQNPRFKYKNYLLFSMTLINVSLKNFLYKMGIISPCPNGIKKCLLKLAELQLCKTHTIKTSFWKSLYILMTILFSIYF